MDVSICMPYFERMKRLMKTLDTFYRCGYFEEDHEPKVEVSICDDGSIREPIPMAWVTRAWAPVKVTWLEKKEAWMNPCVPLNHAVRQADTELILLQSPETYHTEPIISKMASSIKDYKDIVLGCVRWEGNKETCERSQGDWVTHPVHRPSKYWFSQMMTRQLFDEVGGLPEQYRSGAGWEDAEFIRILTDAGAIWIWREDCISTHVREPTDVKRTGAVENKKLYDADTIRKGQQAQ